MLQSVSFGKMVVIRESLLPLLKAMGTSTAPQLRAPCLNKHLLQVDFSLQLREATAFVMESSSSPVAPALHLEQISVQGHLLTCWDLPTNSQPPSLSLLSTTTVDGSQTKRSVRGHFRAQAGVVSVGVTEPLMKLSRHLVETSKTLSHSPQPRAKSPAAGGGATSTAQLSDLWQFTQNLVGQLTSLQNELPHVSISRPSSASSLHSRSVRAVVADSSQCPRNSEGSHHLSPPADPPSSLQCGLSVTSSDSEVAIAVDQSATTPTSPASQSPLDTSGADLPSSEDMHLSSGSHHRPSSPPPVSAVPPQPSVGDRAGEWIPDVSALEQILQTPPTQLSHSIFGSVRIDSVSVGLHVETSTSSLRMAGIASTSSQFLSLPLSPGITGSVDSRRVSNASGVCHFLPSYLSVVATVKTSQLGVSDRTL